MDHHEIIPAPLTTMEDLHATLDLIHLAARQWITDDDDRLAALLNVRASEALVAAKNTDGSAEDWIAIINKSDEIMETIRQKTIHDLNIAFDLS